MLEALRNLMKEKPKLSKPKDYVIGNVSSAVLTESSEIVRIELSLYYSTARKVDITKERNIDLPIYFNFQDLLESFFDDAISEQENSGNRLREFVSTCSKLMIQIYLLIFIKNNWIKRKLKN